ncbi:hypothetical protein D3C84_1269520 [compost metagenome]
MLQMVTVKPQENNGQYDANTANRKWHVRVEPFGQLACQVRRDRAADKAQEAVCSRGRRTLDR